VADSLNTILEEGHLFSSICQGVIRLLHKVKNALLARQLKPINILKTDCQLLTKVFINRLLGVLSYVLQKAKLCSVRTRTSCRVPFLFVQWLHSFSKGRGRVSW
jgi:hypothetical protein